MWILDVFVLQRSLVFPKAVEVCVGFIDIQFFAECIVFN